MVKIKLIDFGGRQPERAHYNDAGADVFSNDRVVLWPHSITKVPLGFGIELPDGMAAFVLARSGKSCNEGITTEVVPIDSGYRGEIHAIIYNANDTHYTIQRGDKIAQLVIVPVVLADFTYSSNEERGAKGFGSTDKK